MPDTELAPGRYAFLAATASRGDRILLVTEPLTESGAVEVRSGIINTRVRRDLKPAFVPPSTKPRHWVHLKEGLLGPYPAGAIVMACEIPEVSDVP